MTQSILQSAARKLAALILFAFWLVCPVQAQQAELDRLNQERRTLNQQGHHEQAITVAQQALQVAENTFGANHQNVVSSLMTLADLYKAQGQYALAEPLLKRSLAISESADGPDSLNSAVIMATLANLYKAQGQYALAEPLLKRSLAISEKDPGPGYIFLSMSLVSLDDLYKTQGQYALAEPLLRDSLANLEKDLRPDDPDVVSGLRLFAKRSQNFGRYTWAETIYKKLLEIQEKTLGPDHVNVVDTLVDLSLVYLPQQQYALAESPLKRSLAIAEKTLGPNHRNVAIIMEHLAEIYASLGQYVLAESLYKRSLAINEQAFGLEHSEVANDLTILGTLYQTQGQYAQAESLYKRSLAIFEKTIGQDHPASVVPLHNLGGVYADQNKYEQAELILKRALAISEKTLDPINPNNPIVSASLNNLASMYIKQGQYALAEPLLIRALALLEKSFDSNHPNVASTLYRLASLYEAQGRYAQALPLARRATAIHRQRIVAGGTGDFSIRYATKSRSSIFQHMSLLSLNPDHESGDKLTDESFQIVQLAQTSGTAAAMAKMAVRFATGDDAVAGLVRRLQDASAWNTKNEALVISAASKPPKERNASAEKKLRDDIGQATQDIARINAELTLRFPDFQELTRPEPLDVANAQTLLKPDEALVTYLVGEKELMIWVVRPGQAHMLRVDATKESLSKRVTMLRRRVDLSRGVLPYYSTAEAYALYETVFAPVTQYLGGVKHVMVVADGPLQSLPFGLLVTSPVEAKSKAPVPWLVRQYAFSNLPSVSSLRALRRFEKGANAPEPFIGFGDPLLEGKSGLARNISMGKIFARGAVADVSEVRRLPLLPETASELKAMAKSMGSTGDNVWLRDAATERRAKTVDLSRFRVVAFATHGLISGEFPGLAQPSLVLTPPETPSEIDDGLLTASEITGLKLNADWVILSACNTASANGEPGAEGFSGLAKAFFYAGTKALLVSHWAVDSKNTVALTSRLFAETKGGAAPAEALRRAMISLADNPRTAHPAFWAPFVVVGEGWKADPK